MKQQLPSAWVHLCRIVLLSIVFGCTSAARAEQFIIEAGGYSSSPSVNNGQNEDWYSSSGFSHSSANLTAQDCTPGIGCDFGTHTFTNPPVSTVILHPHFAVAGGKYTFQTALPTTANKSSDIVVSITTSNSTGLPATTTVFGSSSINVWLTIGTLQLNPGADTDTITLTYYSGTLDSNFNNGHRWYSAAFRFVNVGDVCLGGLPQLTSINGPLVAGQTYVDVPNIASGATKVTVYAIVGSTTNQIGQLTSGVVTGVNRVTTTALQKGALIIATQSNSSGVESCLPLSGPEVGGGPNPRIRVSLSIGVYTNLAGPIGAGSSGAYDSFYFLGATGVNGVAGFTTAPAGGKVIQPNGAWQLVSFTNVSNGVQVDGSYAWYGAHAGTYGTLPSTHWGFLDAIAFCLDDTNDTGPFNVYIDDVRNGTNLLQNFEPFANGATEILFKTFNPSNFTVTPATYILTSPNIAAVTSSSGYFSSNSLNANWQFNSDNVATWARLRAGGTGTTAYPQVDLSQPISFRMLLLPAGQTNATLEVGNLSSITTNSGATLVLNVPFDGTGPFTYQWTKDGATLNGATNSAYSITHAQVSDSGAYSLLVSNATAFATGSGVVTITPPPSLSQLQFTNGTLTMTMSNLAGWSSIVLQSSTNLQDWVSIQTNSIAGGTISLTNTMNAASSGLFLRAVLE